MRLAVDAGHAVAVLSRNPPAAGAAGNIRGAEYFRADVTTGEGIAAALAGADVVIDCLVGRAGKARKNFADGGARLSGRRPGRGNGQGAKGQLVRLPLPGAMGRYLREGLDLVPDARHGTETSGAGWKTAQIVCSLGTPATPFRQDRRCFGAIAQLVERFVRIEEVRSSNLLSSTDFKGF